MILYLVNDCHDADLLAYRLLGLSLSYMLTNMPHVHSLFYDAVIHCSACPDMNLIRGFYSE